MVYKFHLLQALGLDDRSLRVLLLDDIVTAEALTLAYKDGLSNMPGAGAKTVAAAEAVLEKLGGKEAASFPQAGWRELVEFFIVYSGLPRIFRDELITASVFSIDSFILFVTDKKEVAGRDYKLKYNTIIDRQAVKELSRPVFAQFVEREVLKFLPFVRTYKEYAELFRYPGNIILNSVPTASYVDLFYNNPHLRRVAKRYVLDFIARNGGFPVMDNGLLEPCPSLLFDELREDAAKEGKFLLFKDNWYVLETIGVADWVETFTGRNKNVLQMRLFGYNLSQLGDIFHLTRERVRQICRKMLLTRPVLREDRFLSLFSKYDWDAESFCGVTGEPESTFYYLRLVAKKGEKDISLLPEDSLVPEELKARYVAYMQKGKILVNGKYIPAKPVPVFNELVKAQAAEPVSVSDFMSAYKRFIKKAGIKDNVDRKAVMARLGRMQNFIFGRKDLFRAYPVMDVDIARLEQEIGLSSIEDCVLSAKVLFAKYPDIMAEYGLRDHYELHNLLRQRRDSLSVKDMGFGRRPMLCFGKCSVKGQAIALLKEHRALRYKELASLYCNKYGMEPASFSANVSGSMHKYREQGDLFVYRDSFLTQKEIRSLRGVLREAVYSRADAISLLARHLPEGRAALVNADTLRQLGYVSRKKIIVRQEYKDIESALDVYFSATPVRYFDHRALNVLSVAQYFLEKMKACSLYHISRDAVVNREWLEEHGYTEDRIRGFVDAVDRFAGDKAFTIFWLRISGFDHDFLKNSENDWLLASFLKGSRKFKYRTMASGTVFNRYKRGAGVSLIVNDILARRTFTMDVFDEIKEKYGIAVSAPQQYVIRKKVLAGGKA